MSDRTCCVCRQGGRHYQLHHLDGNPSNHDPDNLAVLCLQHHGDAETRGGIGRKLSPEQIRLYRQEWYEQVEAQRRMIPGTPSPDRVALDRQSRIRRLVREGTELFNEAVLAGSAAESTRDSRSVEEKRADLNDYRNREDAWTRAVETELAGTAAAVDFMDVQGIPSTDYYAVHNRVKARVDFLRDGAGFDSPARTPRERLVAAIEEGMRLRTRTVAEPDEVLPFSVDPLFLWARRAYDVLMAHFVLFADDFYGEDPELGPGYFGLAYACALDDMDRPSYLESRLSILKRALREA